MKRTIAMVLVALVGSGPAWADAPPTIEKLLEVNPRIYIGGSVGMTTLDTRITNLTGTAELDEDDFGIKYYGGVRINRIFGLEAHYADLGRRSLSGNPGDRFNSGGRTLQFIRSATITTDEVSYGLAATAGFDISERFRPFAKFGGHRWSQEGRTSTSNTSTTIYGIDFFFGVGVQAEVFKGLSVRAEFERFQFDGADDVNFFSTGAIVQF
jgi:opacity protein-like surface antigen